MTILSILFGIGAGFLQRGSTDLDLARAILRDQIRLAYTTSRARSLPTEVVVNAPTNSTPASVQARVLVPIGVWHMEPGERFASTLLEPKLTGESVAEGRFGHAWRPDRSSRLPMLALPTGLRSTFDLSAGFAFRIELKLEERAAMTIARLGRALVCTLGSELVPEVRMTLADPGPRAGQTISVKGHRTLQLGEWTTLEAVHDGRMLRLFVDGREAGSALARGSAFQEARDTFEVSAADAPVTGLVDEVQLLAYELGEPKSLPGEAHLVGLQRPIAFGRRGELIAPIEFKLVLGEQNEVLTVAPGGVLQ